MLMKQEMSGSGISWTTLKLLVPCSRQIALPAPHHLIFTGHMLFLTATNSVEALKARHVNLREFLLKLSLCQMNATISFPSTVQM